MLSLTFFKRHGINDIVDPYRSTVWDYTWIVNLEGFRSNWPSVSVIH